MKKPLRFIQLILLLSTVACQHTDVPPAQPIEGIFQAQDYDHFSSTGDAVAYPINGQTLTLTISAISADTVSVTIAPSASTSPLPAGIYSPTQALTYPKAYVERTDGASYIFLTGKPKPGASANNEIWLYKGTANADYIFTPTQTPTISRAIRFVRK